ncbi:MAG: S49 family peptidase [Patescibacteria group bacterium]|nr:S49 family peptidase [Patescibacteria group bacterium]
MKKSFWGKVFVLSIVLTVAMFWFDQFSYYFGDYDYLDEYSEEYNGEYEYGDESYWDEGCNVAGIALRGELVTYVSAGSMDEDGYAFADQTASEDIVYAIDEAEKSDSIKAIILEIDSVGGGPVAAEEVVDALKKATKPTVALIREYGNSAAYWAATGADIIFALANSDVGSIGVTMSYLDYAEQNREEGLNYNQLSSGKFKDAGDYDKPLTGEERKLFMRDVAILHENFVRVVAENRGLAIEEVRALADGSSMLGEMALEAGLIDKIGGFYDVEEYLEEILGEELEVCWYF